MKGKKLSKKIIFAIVAAAIIGAILLTCLGLEIAFLVADKIECWRPDYEKTDIREILDKDELSDEDYEALYFQTGLTRTGIDRILSHGLNGKNKAARIQDDFFAEHTVKNNLFAPYVCTDSIEKRIETVYLEDGDIIVTSSTHLSAWRIGHSGLVTNAAKGHILQANAIGDTSRIGDVGDFNDRVNFMVLSPKVNRETKAKVCKYAEENLTGKIYDPTAGVFSSKDSVNKTQCAHLVWYAYKQFGIDLDSNVGLVVTPKNLANSPLVEVVQVFGFDPVKLWK